MTTSNYIIHGVDRAGSPWEAGRADTAIKALAMLELKRAAGRAHEVYWISDEDDPEAGDIESRLQDEVNE